MSKTLTLAIALMAVSATSARAEPVDRSQFSAPMLERGCKKPNDRAAKRQERRERRLERRNR